MIILPYSENAYIVNRFEVVNTCDVQNVCVSVYFFLSVCSIVASKIKKEKDINWLSLWKIFN